MDERKTFPSICTIIQNVAPLVQEVVDSEGSDSERELRRTTATICPIYEVLETQAMS